MTLFLFNKKGQFEYVQSFYLVISIMAMIAVVFTLVFVFVSYTGKITQMPPEILAESILTPLENDCFSYIDPLSKKELEKSIDLKIFTKQQLESCYNTGDSRKKENLEFQLVLAEFDKKIESKHFIHNTDQKRRVQVSVWDNGVETKTSLLINIQETT